MARILVSGTIGWDVPLWLDRPLIAGRRIGAQGLAAPSGSGTLAGRLGGGAANIASALVLAGHEVLVASRVGQDAQGQYVLFALHERGLSLDGVRVDAGPTPSVQILIEPGGQRTILGIGWRGGWQPWSIDPELVRRFAPDALVLRGAVPEIPAGAGLFDGRLVVAHMPRLGAPPARADVAVGSSDDLGGEAFADPYGAAKAVFGDALAPDGWGVVTDGANGARAGSGETVLAQPAAPADVVDATGAGDVFMAGLADALLANATMAEALAHAAGWAAVAVGIEGSAAEPGAKGFAMFNRG
ncbi:MAG: carbohydrate kinase family protein [Polymorphobacter sp.]|uniref:carbohydrate kinase family protein n=1 Tax=Polymorphobacter sp. TaxID=1909290 RepID=UPI003A83CD49